MLLCWSTVPCGLFVGIYLTSACSGLAVSSWPYVHLVTQLCTWTNGWCAMSLCVCFCVCLVSHCSPDKDSVAQAVCPLTRFGGWLRHWDVQDTRSRWEMSSQTNRQGFCCCWQQWEWGWLPMSVTLNDLLLFRKYRPDFLFLSAASLERC